MLRDGRKEVVLVDVDGAANSPLHVIASCSALKCLRLRYSPCKHGSLNTTIISIFQKTREPDDKSVERRKPLGHLRV